MYVNEFTQRQQKMNNDCLRKTNDFVWYAG